MTKDLHYPGTHIIRGRVGWPLVGLLTLVLLTLGAATGLAIWAGLAGPPGGRPDDWLKNTEQGNYRVTASSLNGELGQASYTDGSYIAEPASQPYVAIVDGKAGTGWLVSLEDLTCLKETGEDLEALSPYDWWLPSFAVTAWSQLPGAWEEDVFIADAGDGFLVTLEMKGPGHLLSTLLITKGGEVRDRRDWEYSSLGEVVRDDLRPPAGANCPP